MKLPGPGPRVSCFVGLRTWRDLCNFTVQIKILARKKKREGRKKHNSTFLSLSRYLVSLVLCGAGTVYDDHHHDGCRWALTFFKLKRTHSCTHTHTHKQTDVHTHTHLTPLLGEGRAVMLTALSGTSQVARLLYIQVGDEETKKDRAIGTVL